MIIRMMDVERRNLTEKIIALTLEIIYLLTGEDYELVKKKSDEQLAPNSLPHEPSSIAVSPPQSLTPKISYSKILEVTKKMMELLTGEVPIRCQDVTVYFSMEEVRKMLHTERTPNWTYEITCLLITGGECIPKAELQEYSYFVKCASILCQDVTVYFSMEEWEYLEGHKDLYKDIMMENQPPLTSPDGSSNGNPPERCPHPLYSRDSTQEDHTNPHHHQDEDLIDIKVEVKEEEEEADMGGDHQSTEEGEIIVTIKDEESSVDISTGKK
ncbi:hypothetical protein AB205_0046290 [Aquarana catesbeiana]|uniref:KRAB domain-containing protein n=1 Tax=Aquarana catesbeiana TaxID=8400 RepID=A0A2G9RTA2_AQUCT|nr:hypothetical protein AB205_0046290 [Aquarana catesbeiana]